MPDFSEYLEDNPLWYKDAIVYEVHIKSFYDSDGDGVGDFKGLTEKLDYLKDLGITAIWILPFYPSPLKDDGYDISDYFNIHKQYGTIRNFNQFLRETHKKGIRVITELVLNHTSDQHPWFQKSRRAKPGSRWSDFYVWSDTPEKFTEARVIFKDFESSNWAWDPVAKTYYWHRFYSHQPDLNYDSTIVQQEIFRVVKFWLGLGVDGLRLDAVPYLYEREGTNCENLPESHTFLKRLRRYVDERFKNRMLLAEANQWSEDAAAYFGDGDECHMAFQFPIMPRMFMALRMEDSFPIIDIFQQTPTIPETCQWALFLRNHDELTLEMVTDEERDYMYRVYAHDPKARINLGIRRRLATLLSNNRKKIELMNGLLFSLPGTPVLYYGDEIGMGDNFHLGDRDGVRTPMQWSADRNAGFSRANPQKLYLPPIIDPEYHFEAINVEAQQINPDSLLWWMKRLIALRKNFKAFSRGVLRFLYPENRKVLAFIRSYQDETVLVVANLSRLAQHVSLDLAEFEGYVPVEVFGNTEFPTIKKEEYYITLSPHSFYWFSLKPQPTKHVIPEISEIQLPTIKIKGGWEDLPQQKFRATLAGVFWIYIVERRWFGGKARHIQSVNIQDIIPMPHGTSIAYITLITVEYTEGEPETYLLPLIYVSGEEKNQIKEKYPQGIIANLELGDKEKVVDGVLCDALVDMDFCNGLIDAIARHRHFKGETGSIIALPTQKFRRTLQQVKISLEPSLLRAEQTNTSVVYGDKLIFKFFRRLGDGINPDLELGLFLTEKTSFTHTPPMMGYLEYRHHKDGEPITLGILQGYVQNQGDAWSYTLDALAHYFEHVLAHPELQAPPIPEKNLLALSEEAPHPLAQETISHYIESARLLGVRTAELHAALSSEQDNPTLVPESFSTLYQRSIFHSMRSLTVQVLRLLRKRVKELPVGVHDQAKQVLELEGSILDRFKSVIKGRIPAMRIRCHGDYHLGQVLCTGKDFVIFDFEGEPARPLSERRLKRSALKDIAGIIRSFHYVAYTALYGSQASTAIRPEDIPVLEQWALMWYLWVSASFLRGYLSVASKTNLLPKDPENLRVLLYAYLLEKTIYEVGYELNNRPDWVKVPLRGVLQLMET